MQQKWLFVIRPKTKLINLNLKKFGNILLYFKNFIRIIFFIHYHLSTACEAIGFYFV